MSGNRGKAIAIAKRRRAQIKATTIASMKKRQAKQAARPTPEAKAP